MKERIITGVIAGIAFILVIIIGKILFTVTIMLLAAIALMELLKMKNVAPLSLTGIFSLFFMWILVIPKQWFDNSIFQPFNLLDIVLVFTVIFLLITVLTKNAITFDEVGFILLSAIYVGFGFHFFIETRYLDQGLSLVFFILFLIWATDSGAYFAGKAFGKRKLWPEISPNKTIEGAIGGIISALIIGNIYHYFFPIFESQLYIIMMIIVVSVVGQLGDLVESALKRHYAVKDSGNLLPGHGGILDRLDSLIFVMPIVYLFHFISF